MQYFSRGKSCFAVCAALCFAACVSLAQTKPSTQISRQEFLDKLVAAAIERTNHSVRYVSTYVHILYPGGAFPEDPGVSSDEITRRSSRRRGFAKRSP